MGKRQHLGLFLGILLMGGAGLADQVTLVGANNPAIDLPALQAAVNVPDRTVYLDGTFDLGPTGRVYIYVPNLTLEGVPTGATIKGGTIPISTWKGVYPSEAKNITIRNIRFENWISWAIYHVGAGAEDNFTLIEGNTFVNPRVGNVAPYALGVGYFRGGGSAEIKNNTFVNLTELAVMTNALTLHPEDHLLIENNTIIDCHYDAISVDVWDRTLGDFDNGPVIIRNNRISLAAPLLNTNACVIDLGFWYVEGVSNAVVEGNVLSGWASLGVMSACYGRNRMITNNDFSGLTTSQGTIVNMGRDSLIAGNVLGPSDQAFAAQLGVPWIATGIILVSQNANPGVWPDTLAVTGNVLTDNDFRGTGLAGWGYDAAGNLLTPGCIMLLSSVDVGWQGPWSGAELTDNLVKETGRFPAGTGGPKQQVLELPVYAYHNRIVGHAANEYAQLEAGNPGIGQKIKDAGVKLMQMMNEKQAFIKTLMEEAEEH